MTEQNEERARLVCVKTTEEARVPSITVECEDCGVSLWRSVGSLDQDADPICFDCLPVDSKPQIAMPQLLELAREFDLDPLEYANYLASVGIEIFDG